MGGESDGVRVAYCLVKESGHAVPGRPGADPARDAAGRGQLFESICVAGFTGIQEGMNGLAIVDLNKDGRLDIVASA